MSENVTEKTKQNNQAAEQRRKPNTGDTRRKQGAKQKQQPKTGQKAAQRPAAPKKTAQTPSRAAKPAAQKPKKPEQPAAPSKGSSKPAGRRGHGRAGKQSAGAPALPIHYTMLGGLNEIGNVFPG